MLCTEISGRLNSVLDKVQYCIYCANFYKAFFDAVHNHLSELLGTEWVGFQDFLNGITYWDSLVMIQQGSDSQPWDGGGM